METWRTILKQSICRPEELPPEWGLDALQLTRVAATYPMRINPYYLSLIKKPGDALFRQAIPALEELQDSVCHEDPLGEENLSPVANLIHKYPDRALFLVCSECAMYCRFCTRKRKVGTSAMIITDDTIRAGLDYVARTPMIRDVLISGGDPLLLSDEHLEFILESLRRIPTVEIIRIGTRVPCTLPMRVTPRLAGMLKKYHPLYINTHFNHPDEITPEATLACTRLANAGIPLGCQTVLLRGVNDRAEIIKKLLQKLLLIRVKPYYIFQGDMTRGTDHFRTPIQSGLQIMRALIGHTSGLAVPTFAVDLPGGHGKVPLTPEYLTQHGAKTLFADYLGRPCSYIDPV